MLAVGAPMAWVDDGFVGAGSEDTACVKSIVPSKRVSSVDKPDVKSVRKPLSNPRRPPNAWKAANDLGFCILFSWPGENAKLLSSTRKSSSCRGSAFRASDNGTSSYLSVLDVVVTSESALGLTVVVTLEVKEPDLGRKVSPSSECEVLGRSS